MRNPEVTMDVSLAGHAIATVSVAEHAVWATVPALGIETRTKQTPGFLPVVPAKVAVFASAPVQFARSPTGAIIANAVIFLQFYGRGPAAIVEAHSCPHSGCWSVCGRQVEVVLV